IVDPLLQKELQIKLEEENWDYIHKLGLIQNSIYGVDIQPIAVEISKLRFFLSLIVDEKIDDTKPNRGIIPLPNLEFKFVSANTLIGLPPFESSFGNRHELIQELKKIRVEYFTAYGKRKKEIENEFKKTQEQMFQLAVSWLEVEQQSFALSSWEPFSFKSNGWFDPDWMFGVTDGFDVVIGNPPYIQLQKAIDAKRKYADLYKDQNFKTFDRTGDIYCLFYEKGIDLLKNQGLLCYITSNKWMRAGYGAKLRSFFTKHNPLKLIDLGPGVFENATVDTNIILIQKLANRNQLQAATITETKKDNLDIAEIFNQNKVTLSKLSADAWFIGSDAEQRLKEKIERIGKPLKEWDVNIYYGIKTGLNEAFIITTEKRNEILANCKDEDERKRTEAIIKPILRGRDIKRYYYEWAGLWVIVAKFGFYKEAHKFQSIVNHLTIYEKELKNRGQCKYTRQNKERTNLDYPGQHHWLELDNNPSDFYLNEFEKEKVVWGNISYDSQFCFVDKGLFINAPANIITSTKTSIKFLIGNMNSKIFDWQFKQVGIFLGYAFEWKKQYVEQVKIPQITSSNASTVQQIETLVDQILAAKKQNPSADTTRWEREIDTLVYKLYDLTDEEIQVVEGNVT
ncbi:MAG TPA: Eco57I restriction-modification methylase domain-containing protein, partial [Spirochaetota bacterium]|nr:Eco57I restriction-modification methylase domain-containing protein [Spirochaetota bacterium]